MVDLGPLDEVVTTGRRRRAREIIRRHNEPLALRLDRYDPIPQPDPDPYVANMLEFLEEQRATLRPNPIMRERR